MADPKRDGVRPAEAWLSRLIGETPADADEKATAQLWLAALRAMQAESFAAGHAAGQADMRERAAEAMQRRGYTMLAVDISKLPISPAGTKPTGGAE